MSWDIVLFNSKEIIRSIENLDENKLEPTDFCVILENSLSQAKIKGEDFPIDFYTDEEPVSNKMVSVYGENGLFELIELAKKNNWQIFDTSLGEMIDLENPKKNGFESHKKYVEQVMKKK